MPRAWFTEADLNEDQDPDDRVSIRYPSNGEYAVSVTPHPDALETETYTLEVEFAGTLLTLAEDVPVSAIPTQPYIVILGENGISLGTEDVRFCRGDANADGNVDIADAICNLSYLFGEGPQPTCLDAADANDDGAVDIADAIALLSHLFAGAGDLPEPFGECGVDPTPEDPELGCESFPLCEGT